MTQQGELQSKLGFAMDPGEITDRRDTIGLVALRLHGMGLDNIVLAARDLLLWIFNVTHSGTAGELTKSYRELAACPWGLCCSESSARRVVRVLKKHGVLAVAENRYQSDGQSANGYSLDWKGIRRLLCPGGRSAGQPDHLPGQPDHPPGQPDHPFKEITLLPDLLLNSDPAGKAPAGREDFFSEIPELAAAAATQIEPRPVGDCAHGIFRPLSSADILDPTGVVPWFRRQLSAPHPATGNTEADVLLVIAAALYVKSRLKDVDRPVGLLISIISRGQWRKVVPYVAEARRLLDDAIAAKGAGPLGRKAGSKGQGAGSEGQGAGSREQGAVACSTH